MTLAVGLHHDVPERDYHADPCETPSLSSSIAKIICGESLLHAYAAHPRLGGKSESDSTPEMVRGSAIHAKLLSNNEGVHVVDVKDWRTKAAREAKAEAIAAGKLPLTAPKNAEYEKACEVIRKKLKRLGIVIHDNAEITGIYSDDGVLCRCRYDLLDFPIVRDFKCVSNAYPESLAKQATRMGWDIQAYSYSQAAGLLAPEYAGRIDYRWVFLEMGEPYDVIEIAPSPAMLTLGQRKWFFALERWREALKLNRWPGRAGMGTVPSHLEPPEWEMVKWAVNV